MKMFGLTGIMVVLLATAAQAVNTVATLNDRGWERSQTSLIGMVGPQNGETAAAGALGAVADASSEGVLQPVLDVFPGLAEGGVIDAVVHKKADALDQFALGLDDMNGVADSALSSHWSADSRRCSAAGLVNANNRGSLPAFADIDWVSSVLPTARETFLMEVVVFPGIAAALLTLVVMAVVSRLRRRRPLSPADQLLHV